MGVGSIAGIAILLLVNLLPGLAFRRFYFTGPFSKQYQKARIDSLLLAAFIPALVLQLYGSLNSEWWETTTFYKFVAEQLFSAKAPDSSSHFQLSYRAIVIHQSYLILSGAILGYLVRFFVRASKLDRKLKLFRFENTWQYIFRGEIYQFPEVSGSISPAEFEGTSIDLLVKGSSEPTIYKGELVDYHLDYDNSIKYLLLANVSRRKISADPLDLGSSADQTKSTRPKRFYDIPGDTMVFKGEHILNINVKLIRFDNQENILKAYYGDIPG
jgi:hypothetical protein